MNHNTPDMVESICTSTTEIRTHQQPLQYPDTLGHVIPWPGNTPVHKQLLHSLPISFFDDLHIEPWHLRRKCLTPLQGHITRWHPKGSHCLILPCVLQKCHISKWAVPDLKLTQSRTSLHDMLHSPVTFSSKGNWEHFNLVSILADVEEDPVGEETWDREPKEVWTGSNNGSKTFIKRLGGERIRFSWVEDTEPEACKTRAMLGNIDESFVGHLMAEVKDRVKFRAAHRDWEEAFLSDSGSTADIGVQGEDSQLLQFLAGGCYHS